MEKIQFEKEVCDYLSLPSIPTKKWDGKSAFKYGVAKCSLYDGTVAYAVCSYDGEGMPEIKKTFATAIILSVDDVFVVPTYMDTAVDEMDLDDASREAAERLAEEAKELTEKPQEKSFADELPEWVFPEIHNKEEAMAWLKQYNVSNKIKGRVPENEETLKLRLLNIYSQTIKKTK